MNKKREFDSVNEVESYGSKRKFNINLSSLKKSSNLKGLPGAMPLCDDDQLEYMKKKIDHLENLWRRSRKEPFVGKEVTDKRIRKLGCICFVVLAIVLIIVGVLSVFVSETVNFFIEKPKTSVEFESINFPKKYPQIVICDYLGGGDLSNAGFVSGLQFVHDTVNSLDSVSFLENKKFNLKELGSDSPKEVSCLVYNTDGLLKQETASSSTFISFSIIVNDSDYMTVAPRLFVIDLEKFDLKNVNEFDEPFSDAIIGHGVYDIVITEEEYIVKKRSFFSLRTESEESDFTPRANGVPLGKFGYSASVCSDGLCYVPVILLAKFSSQKIVTTEFFDKLWYHPFVSAGGVLGTLKILLSIVLFCDTFVCFKLLFFGRKFTGYRLEDEIRNDFEKYKKLLMEERKMEKKKKKEEEKIREEESSVSGEEPSSTEMWEKRKEKQQEEDSSSELEEEDNEENIDQSVSEEDGSTDSGKGEDNPEVAEESFSPIENNIS